MKTIEGLVNNPKWGHPQRYDITITRSGTGFDTEYSVVPNPHTDLDPFIEKDWKAAKINLDALYSGSDPFGAK